MTRDPHILAKIRTLRDDEIDAFRKALREENPEDARDGDVIRAMHERLEDRERNGNKSTGRQGPI